MRAVGVRPGAGSPRILERPRPEPADGEALVRTARVGVDGTDHEVIAGDHGTPPEGADEIVLGHEAVGVVVESNDTGLAEGQVVAPTVRRPAPGGEAYFARGEPDMAPPGTYRERGIVGADGFMAEFFTSPDASLVPLGDARLTDGFLVEPISVVEKALEHATAARSAFAWEPSTALVLGNGSLGLLALARLAEDAEYDRLYCLGRRDRPDPTIDIIEGLGATYVDGRETPVPEVPTVHDAPDLVVEATGHARHPFEAIDALAPNGVAALLGVPGSAAVELDGGDLHRAMVLENKAVVGSVNSNVEHFEAAAEWLASLPAWFREDIVTGTYGLWDIEQAFATDDTTIKTAVEFHP